tara:strand:- start:34 stop:798 length:765 start_codon:yes stop_codon:yes gene_type:complete
MNKIKKFRIVKFKSKPLLRAKDISKSFDDRIVLQNLNFSISPGEIFGLLGPNGAGKSVTFQILIGITKADHGEVLVSGSRVNELPIHERTLKYKIGYIPQNESVFRGLSAEDNLRSICEISIKNKEIIENTVTNLLSDFSLTDVRKVAAKNLSGGQRKKLVIARALINKPRILIMDEPFSAIDPINIEVIKKIIVNLQNRGISILVSDHSFQNVISCSDRVAIISDGQIIASGTPKQIISDEQARKVYFGESFY